MDIENLREYLREKFSQDIEKDEFEFISEMAIYYFAEKCHSGQNSDLYEILCNIRYKPGICTSFEKEIQEFPIIEDMISGLSENFR